MSFSFVLLALVIVVPFALFGWAHQRHRHQQHQALLNALMVRVGLPSSEHKKVLNRFQNYRDTSLAKRITSLLKKAGLTQKKTVLGLAVAQSVSVMVSIYLVVTQAYLIDPKLGALAFALPLMPMGYVFFRLRQRQQALKKQFPDMLEALVRALQSGLAMDGAMQLMANEFKDPLGGELRDVTKQLSVGVSMREVLQEFQVRVDLPEAQFFVITLLIQRETGGRLSAILQELARLMRRRESFQGKVKTLTAESRFTALFIGGAPILYLLYKYFFDPKSMNFYLTDPTGQKMLILSLALIISGSLILRRMLRIQF